MSVSTEEGVSYAVWGGDGAPFPFGMWFVNIGDLLSGDATGGTHTLTIVFATAAGGRNSNFYSLEQITMNGSGTTRVLGELQARNLGFHPTKANTQLNQLWLLDTNVDDVGNFTMMRPRDTLRRVLLGRQTTVGTLAGLRLQSDNVNMRGITMSAMGYVWSAAAISWPGGPKRPENGLFT